MNSPPPTLYLQLSDVIGSWISLILLAAENSEPVESIRSVTERKTSTQSRSVTEEDREQRRTR